MKDKKLIIAILGFIAFFVAMFVLLNRQPDNTQAPNNVTITNEATGETFVSEEAKDTEPVKGLVIDIAATDEVTHDELAEKLSDMFVTLAGFSNAPIGEHTEIYLINSDENDPDVYMLYNVLDADGNIIFETNLIPVGKHIIWKPYEYLHDGENQITIVSKPYYAYKDSYVTLTSGANTVTYIK